jgi:hypothetical protein
MRARQEYTVESFQAPMSKKFAIGVALFIGLDQGL